MQAKALTKILWALLVVLEQTRIKTYTNKDAKNKPKNRPTRTV